jgi:hypothetical protein
MMRVVFSALFVVALAIASGAAQLPPPLGQVQLTPTQSPTPPSAAVSGIVYDAATGRPLPGAIVTLGRLDGGTPIPRSVTDSKGRFIFRQLEPSDQYYLGARRFGYEYTRYGWSGPNQSLATADIARIAVSKDQWIPDIRIPLWQLGSISGRVLDERGEPLVGVAVRVFSHALVSGQRQLLGGELATTDDLGRYHVTGLQPGTYSVAVLSVQTTVLQAINESPIMQPVGQLADSGVSVGRGIISTPTIDVDGKHRLVITNFATPPPPSSEGNRAYPLTFYPGVSTPVDATPIEIAWGSTQTAIDVHVRPVAAVRVSGRLVTPAGEPAPQLLLRLMAAGMERLGFGTEVATTPVEPDGSFTFLNVPSGRYTLLAQATVTEFSSGSTSRRVPEASGFVGASASVGSADGAPDLDYLSRTSKQTDFWARMPLSVSARDMADVNVPLQHAAVLQGRIALSEGFTLPADTRIFVSLVPANGDPALGLLSGSVDVTKPDRTFTVGGLLGGTYLLSASISVSAPGARPTRVASVVWQGREARDIGLDASSGEDFHDVVVTLTDKTIEINGTVTGANGPQIAAVIAFPVDRSRWTNFGLRPANFEGTRSASSGSFRLERLVEGDYYLIAVDSSQRNAWVDARFLSAAAPLASRVSLKWGDKQTVNLSLATVVIK